MVVLEQSAAQAILSPYLDRLASSFEHGVSQWRVMCANMPDVALDVSRRGQSNLLYDLIAAQAEREFRPDAPDVRVQRKHGFLVIVFHGVLALRIKKFRKNHMYQTYGSATSQRLQWEQQGLLMPEVGRPVTHAVAGYLLDDLRQELKEVAVACRNGRFLEWVIPADSSTAGTSAEPTLLPAIETGVQDPIVRSTKTNRDKEAQ